MLAIPCIHRASGLAMLWKEEITLHIQIYSQYHINAHIMIDPSNPWRLTSFYGRSKEHRRHKSWSYLRHLHARDSLSWVCLGDFNEILNSAEKQGRLPKPHRLMEAFHNALLHCGLIDLGYRGNIFTWQNGRPGDAFVQERLDKACATLDWRERFPHAVVNHLQVSYSNHDPIFIIINGSAGNTKRKKIPKRFEEKWATHPECEAIIQEVWSRDHQGAALYFDYSQK